MRCAECGATSAVPVRWSIDSAADAVDPHFGVRLWLQAPCRGHVLWAWNARHLDFLSRAMGAMLRQRAPNVNGSMMSRLPPWMKDRHAREDVLRAVSSLRRRLDEAGALGAEGRTGSGLRIPGVPS